MAGRECYHCKQWIEEGEEHDCWTTTEAALTKDLPEDLQDAWQRLREPLADRSARGLRGHSSTCAAGTTADALVPNTICWSAPGLSDT